MIHIVGARIDIIDQTADGVNKYGYETMVDVYTLDLTKSHSYDLIGPSFDMPSNIAINALGDIAVTGYGIKQGSPDQTVLFDSDHQLIMTYGGNMKSLIASGDAFIGVGSTGGYSSQYFDGYAFMFDADGIIWKHTERGFDMDSFTCVEKTDQGFLLFGDTESHTYPDVNQIGFAVYLDEEGNVLERVYYPEAAFVFPSLAHVTEGTWMVSFDVVSYPSQWIEEGWGDHRIPRALLYDMDGNLLESHAIYFEKYVMFESSIVVAYGDPLYVIASLGYQGINDDDIGDPSSGLFFVRIHQGD
jgi:hypothetical protein